ncbi:hypothetical protein MTR_3g116190 [Medicago truncatula]|uniref:Uncharacterized protein n=1 Tax=Medicago truncatula TaxID=3880 RepID=G7J6H4_MEDTR|nr:hypothetical protein MTR_3g116190 [Medicago truncatula]
MGSGWVPIYPLPVLYLCFEIGENSNTYSNPVKTGKTRQIGFGSGGTHVGLELNGELVKKRVDWQYMNSGKFCNFMLV